MGNGGAIQNLFFYIYFFNNQYNDLNIGFKVFYGCIVTFDVYLNLDYHTFILKKNSVALLHYVICTPITGTSACYTIAPDAPSQEVGYWSEIILHTAQVFVDSTPGVLF